MIKAFKSDSLSMEIKCFLSQFNSLLVLNVKRERSNEVCSASELGCGEVAALQLHNHHYYYYHFRQMTTTTTTTTTLDR